MNFWFVFLASDLEKENCCFQVKVASGKRSQIELEDKILGLLASASGSLLDNVDLINALDKSKVTYEEINESLKVRNAFVLSFQTFLFRWLRQRRVKSTVLRAPMNRAPFVDLFSSLS